MPTVCASEPVQAPTTTTRRPSLDWMSALISLGDHSGAATSGTSISEKSRVTSLRP